MKKILSITFSYLLLSAFCNAQYSGFSKLYRYTQDTFVSADFISAIHYSETNDNIYIFLSRFTYSYNGKRNNVFYRLDKSGDILQEFSDSIFSGDLLN